MEYGILELSQSGEVSLVGQIFKWYIFGMLIYLCLISFIHLFKPKHIPSIKTNILIRQTLLSWISIIVTIYKTIELLVVITMIKNRNKNKYRKVRSKNVRGFMFDYAEYYSAKMALDRTLKLIPEEEKKEEGFNIFLEDSNAEINYIHSDIIEKYGDDYSTKYEREINFIKDSAIRAEKRLNGEK